MRWGNESRNDKALQLSWAENFSEEKGSRGQPQQNIPNLLTRSYRYTTLYLSSEQPNNAQCVSAWQRAGERFCRKAERSRRQNEIHWSVLSERGRKMEMNGKESQLKLAWLMCARLNVFGQVRATNGVKTCAHGDKCLTGGKTEVEHRTEKNMGNLTQRSLGHGEGEHWTTRKQNLSPHAQRATGLLKRKCPL